MRTNLQQKILNKISKNEYYKIVFLGDSLTSAEWVHPNFRDILEYVLKDYLVSKVDEWWQSSWNIRFYNSSFDGSGTKDILSILDEHTFQLNPDLVIYLGTRNDLDYGIDKEEHSKNIKKIRKLLSENIPDFIYATSLKSHSSDGKNKEYQTYVDLLNNHSRFENEIYLDLLKITKNMNVDDWYTFKLDDLDADAMGGKAGDLDLEHPNVLGNAYIAKFLLEEVFGIEFKPEKYLESIKRGDKYPEY